MPKLIKLPKELKAKIKLLSENYRKLDSLYRKGQFEVDVTINEFGSVKFTTTKSFFHPTIKELNSILVPQNRYRIDFDHQTQTLLETVGITNQLDGKFPPFLLASYLLYLQASELDKNLYAYIENRQEDFGDVTSLEITNNPIRLIIRSHVLAYEVSDYFLLVPPQLRDWILNKSFHLTNSKEPINELIKNEYSIPNDGKLITEIKKDKTLVLLLAANDYYRRHDVPSYEESERILSFVKDRILDTKNKYFGGNAKNLSLIGLYYYIKGRVSFASGKLKDSNREFRKSTEFYRQKLFQDELKFKEDKISSEEFERLKLLLLRRISLTTIFGSGFQALVESRVKDSLKLGMISNSVLLSNSGMVYKTYSLLIYQSARRAFHSSNADIIVDVVHQLNNCRKIFLILVPHSHYVHRAGIELSLALHYLSRSLDYNKKNLRLKNDTKKIVKQLIKDSKPLFDNVNFSKLSLREKIYKLALGFLKEASVFRKDKNTRLKCEALTITSHLLRFKPYPNLEKALKNAKRSVELSKEMEQMYCEAEIALGAALVSKAERKSKPDSNELAKQFAEACQHFENALQANSENYRISGVAFLQLSEVYLKINRISLARHFYQRWEKIKEHIDHHYVHQKASEISTNLNMVDHVFSVESVDNKDIDYWQEELNKWFVTQKLIEFAQEILEKPDALVQGTSFNGREYLELLRKNKKARGLRPPLIMIARQIFGGVDSTAYNKIATYNALSTLEKLLSEM